MRAFVTTNVSKLHENASDNDNKLIDVDHARAWITKVDVITKTTNSRPLVSKILWNIQWQTCLVAPTINPREVRYPPVPEFFNRL